MIHAYDKNYLTAAQKCLARMLDYMVNDLQYPLETVWNWFLMSEISHRFELGDSTMRMTAVSNTGRAGLSHITSGIPGCASLKLSRLCRFPRCECCIRPTMKWTFASLLIR